jgi:hypothetical protein
MNPTIIRIAVAIAMAFAGWWIGRAQTSVAEFELRIDAPGPGQVNLTCIRGCSWNNRPNVATVAQPHTTWFSCGGQVDRCGGVVDGHGIVIRRTDGPSNRPPLAPQ